MAAPTLSPGDNFGKFRLVEELGVGGMGIVFRAYDTQLQRDVAIKVLNDRTLGDTKSRQRFRSEALILSRLNHPNVECVYEFCSEGNIDLLVLEYVPGTTLNELIKSEHLPEQEVIGLGIQLARGLAAAHGQRVIHRDLKPRNLRVTPDNVLKILDFGLAQLMPVPEDPTLDADAVLTQNPLAGTPAYLSPEQIRGIEPDTRSDIYSAGVVLYELATGCKPFPQTGQLLLDSILNGIPAAPRSHNKGISFALEAVIQRCLEKDPNRRYQSARELQIDLERLSTEHHPSGPSLASPQFATISNKRRTILLAVVVLGVLAIAGMFAWRHWRGEPVEQRVMAVLPMDTVGQDPATTALGLGLTETVAAKLVQASDTSSVQVVSPQDLRDQKVKTAEDAQRVFGTDYVLESSMQRSGNAIRVNCYLVDPKTHRQIAAKTIESDATDPFGLQDKVVSATLDMMAVRLKPEERRKLNAVQDTQPAAYEAYVRGRGYLQEYEKPENIENAIAEFNQAIKIDPNYALGYAGLGDAYWTEFTRLDKGGDVTQQVTDYCVKALSIKPELAEAHICLGNILNGTGQYSRAAEEFKRAVRSNAQSGDALRGLADAYRNLGDLSAAERVYKQAIALRPSYWAVYHWAGIFYYSNARYSEALEMFQRETQLAPDNYQSYSSLGGIYMALGEYQQAVDTLNHSISLRPSSDAYSDLGYAYYLMHRFPEAISAEEEAIKLNSGGWEVWGNLADALYWSSTRKSEATAAYRHAADIAASRLQLNPRDARIRVYLGGYLAMIGDKQKAIQYAHQAVEEGSSYSEIWFRAAVIYSYIGKLNEALDCLKKAVALGYSEPIIRDSPEFQHLQMGPRLKVL